MSSDLEVTSADRLVATRPRRSGSVYRVASLALGHLPTLLGVPLALVLAVGIATLLQPREYVSTVAFAPRTTDPRGGLGAVAAQFGVALGSTEPSQSPDFFADLVRSREILEPVADSAYEVNGHRINLLDAYKIHEATPALARERLLTRLASRVVVGRNVKTGVVTASVNAPDPTLSYLLAEHLVQEVNAFNLRTRQEKAAAEVKFVEQRLDALRAEQAAAENRLLAFRMENRNIFASPQLQSEQERLQRDVTQRQQVVSVLAQSYEQARIDAVRNTPVITIVQRPRVPVLPEPRQLVLKLLLSAIVGGTLACAVIIAREGAVAARAADPEAFEQFRSRLPSRQRGRIPSGLA